MKLKREEFDVLVQGKKGQPGQASKPPKGIDIIPPTGQEEDDDQDQGDGGEQSTSTVRDLDKERKQGKSDSSDSSDSGSSSGSGSGSGSGEGSGSGSGSGSGGDKAESGDGKGKGGKGGKSGVPSENPDGSVDASSRGVGGILTSEESKQIQEELGVPYMPSFDEQEIKRKLAELEPLLDKSQGARNQGLGAGNQKRLLADAVAKIIRPIVNWKSLLKKFIGRALGKQEEDILPNRRYVSSGDYVHGSKEMYNNFNTCVIAVDTSGSMGEKELMTILNEIKGIAQTSRINNFDIVYFDDGIRGIEHLTSGQAKQYTASPPGGGGTTFKEPLEYMEKIRKTGKLDLAIFMTDGYADLNLPVPRYKDKFIWVILDNPSFKPPWGSKLVHIEVPRGKG